MLTAEQVMQLNENDQDIVKNLIAYIDGELRRSPRASAVLCIINIPTGMQISKDLKQIPFRIWEHVRLEYEKAGWAAKLTPGPELNLSPEISYLKIYMKNAACPGEFNAA